MKITLSDMCRGAGFERMRTKTFWAFCHRPFSCAQKKITSRLIGYKYYDGDRNTQIRLSVRTMRESFEKPLGTKSAFAIGNVAQVKKTSQACGTRVRIVHEPEPKNPGHSAIRQLLRDDLSLLEALAADAFTELVRNIDIQFKPDEPQSHEI